MVGKNPHFWKKVAKTVANPEKEKKYYTSKLNLKSQSIISNNF
jgi:hypothetical protein